MLTEHLKLYSKKWELNYVMLLYYDTFKRG